MLYMSQVTDIQTCNTCTVQVVGSRIVAHSSTLRTLGHQLAHQSLSTGLQCISMGIPVEERLHTLEIPLISQLSLDKVRYLCRAGLWAKSSQLISQLWLDKVRYLCSVGLCAKSSQLILQLSLDKVRYLCSVGLWAKPSQLISQLWLDKVRYLCSVGLWA
jgi:hypothetical protein